jgi:DNA repair photolyase
LTRDCLALCAAFRNPVSVITKSNLIRRDVDVLGQLASHGALRVFLSIPFADDKIARAIEPFAPPPTERFHTLKLLSDAGIPTGVSLAPLIPGLNDSQIPEVLERARAAGARHAFTILLRLPGEVEAVFTSRLRAALPLRAERVLNTLRQMHGGRLSDSRFGERMRGTGPRWQVVQELFDKTCRRLGFTSQRERGDVESTFRRPGQRTLFDR